MTEMIIDNDIMIDDVESVLFGIRDLSGRRVADLEVVKRFVNQEKNTRFYLDNKLNSFMQKQPGCIYVWIDTGFTDYNGNPILISLLQGIEGFCGHVVGTIRTLAENIKKFFRLNNGMVNKKVDALRKKYQAKSDERIIKHILDEQRYLVESFHQIDGNMEFAAKLEALEIVFEGSEETASDIAAKETPEANINTELSRVEEEITVGLLLEKMESMQSYMDELLRELEMVNAESRARIDELQKKNDEYRRVILQMREFSNCNAVEETGSMYNPEDMTGHDLLGVHGKILVIGGQELGVNVMHGIAKTMGFEKKDLEFVDYDKAKDYTERIRKGGKYSAVIFGACPHKTSAGAGYSSALEKFRRVES